MNATSGNLTCQAAVFVYKGDSTAQQAWQDVQQMEDIRAELHEKKTTFLAALKTWNSQPGLEPGNAFLGIYAHMGPPGLAPVGDGPALKPNIVSWQELAAALPNRVHTCWLVGCTSEAVLKVWPAAGGPILGRLLVTQVNEAWRPLVGHFAEEISMDPINYPDEMRARLLQLLPTLGGKIDYYEAANSGWKVCFP